MAIVKINHVEFNSKKGNLNYNPSNKYYFEDDGKDLGVKVSFLKNSQKLQGSQKNIVKLLNKWGVPGKSLKDIKSNSSRNKDTRLTTIRIINQDPGKFTKLKNKFRR